MTECKELAMKFNETPTGLSNMITPISRDLAKQNSKDEYWRTQIEGSNPNSLLPAYLQQRDSWDTKKNEAYLKKKEMYKYIMMKYDEERDQRISAAQQLYNENKNSFNMNQRISEEYF